MVRLARKREDTGGSEKGKNDYACQVLATQMSFKLETTILFVV